MRLYAENLCLIRGGRRLFGGVSFRVLEGEALVVQGSNGAGKSSLLRAIAGLLSFSGGRLQFEGVGRESALIEQTHYLGHSNSMRVALTAHENLAFWAQLLGGSVASVDAALVRLGLAHVKNFPVGSLSAGQQRRVALARLLVTSRRLWLLDEPTTALDIGSQALFAAAMQTHLSEGGLIVAATHTVLGIEECRKLDLDAADFALVGENM